MNESLPNYDASRTAAPPDNSRVVEIVKQSFRSPVHLDADGIILLLRRAQHTADRMSKSDGCDLDLGRHIAALEELKADFK